VSKLASLEEVEGVLWAADTLGRALPAGEADLLEKRVVHLQERITENFARTLIAKIRSQTERADNANG
jgi:hypothetical protein